MPKSNTWKGEADRLALQTHEAREQLAAAHETHAREAALGESLAAVEIAGSRLFNFGDPDWSFGSDLCRAIKHAIEILRQHDRANAIDAAPTSPAKIPWLMFRDGESQRTVLEFLKTCDPGVLVGGWRDVGNAVRSTLWPAENLTSRQAGDPVASHQAIAIPIEPATSRIILHHGGTAFSCAGIGPVSVTTSEAAILQAFLECSCCSQEELVRISGWGAAPRTLRNLRGKYDGMFSHAITLPGGKGRGGYRVDVRPANDPQVP